MVLEASMGCRQPPCVLRATAASPPKPPEEPGSRSTRENENSRLVACVFSFLLSYSEGTRPSGFVYKPVLVFVLAELLIFSLVLLALLEASPKV